MSHLVWSLAGCRLVRTVKRAVAVGERGFRRDDQVLDRFVATGLADKAESEPLRQSLQVWR